MSGKPFVIVRTDVKWTPDAERGWLGPIIAGMDLYDLKETEINTCAKHVAKQLGKLGKKIPSPCICTLM
jgi:hypothetical protein